MANLDLLKPQILVQHLFSGFIWQGAFYQPPRLLNHLDYYTPVLLALTRRVLPISSLTPPISSLTPPTSSKYMCLPAPKSSLGWRLGRRLQRPSRWGDDRALKGILGKWCCALSVAPTQNRNVSAWLTICCGSDLVVMDGIERHRKNRIFEALMALFDP